MANEGTEVIHANNRRVATAKKATALTAKNLQAAKEAGDVAQETLDAAQKVVEAAQKGLEAAKKTIEEATADHDKAAEELKDAEKSQEAAQKKWEVVDLVKEDEEQPKSSSGSKKRAGASSDSKANASKKVRSDIPKEVTVEGCGVSEVNGIYKRIIDDDGRGAPRYFKTGQLNGKDTLFDIYKDSRTRSPSWSIRVFRYPLIELYVNRKESSVPPSDGWKVSVGGAEPPPKIT